MLRLPSTLPAETEQLIERVISCCIEVHRAIGPGLLESACTRAVCIELGHEGITYEREKQIPVTYRGELLCHHRLDLVVEKQVILELKSVERLNAVHRAQLLSYMRLSKLRAGLLINFNVPFLKEGLKRIVL